ncbi:MAG: carboxypeptidase regulatory-like domain-containing protein [Verrucomicrobiae bacterium]|nr:carboxypeptidase regulatory-like domain-containing protein [Verrucomicrobiae bacterium]
MNLLLVVAFAVLVLSSPGIAAAQAVIEGKVKLPKRKAPPVVVKRYEIVGKGGVLSPDPPVAIVYLEGTFAKPKQALPVKKILQKDLVFDPALLPIQVGTTVEFPNLDETFHNVFSFSKVNRFDLGRYRADEEPVPSRLFDKAGLVTLRCDIHEHMRALILVLDTPYFVTTDTKGRFKLAGLPAGKYKLRAWLDSKTTLEVPVELVKGEALKVNFE